jgi:hypothetical protein
MEVEKQKPNIKKAAGDIIDITAEVIGVAASPATLWLLVLINSSGGKGFSGHITNPQ